MKASTLKLPWCLAPVLAGLIASVPTSADAATWVSPRTRPHLREVVAIDATGERNWPYKAEDVAGDGLDNFKPAEQSIDARTAYAATDARRLWLRVYVSEPTTIALDATVYVFIDTDKNKGTGGRASATEISPSFTNDPTDGGYEYVIGTRGDGTITNVWQWQTPPGRFEIVTVKADRITAERGFDRDPIRLGGDQRGYVQTIVDLDVVGITQVCNADFYIRSTTDTASLGKGDLDVGVLATCVPGDSNGDHVPDILVPPTECQTDDQCPGRALCVDKRCVFGTLCTSDADCPATEQCSAEGECVARPTGSCTTNDTCDGLVCVSQQCVPCEPGSTTCGSGKKCSTSGRCIDENDNGGGTGGNTAGDGGSGYVPGPGDTIEGGAFNCGIASRPSANGLFGGVFAIGFGLLAAWANGLRNRRRPRR